MCGVSKVTSVAKVDGGLYSELLKFDMQRGTELRDQKFYKNCTEALKSDHQSKSTA